MRRDLRKTFEEIQGLAKTIYSTSPKGSVIEELADKIVGKTIVALFEPTLNCDVGMSEEQIKRFQSYCGCKVCNRRDCACGHEELFRHICAIEWSQMSYESEVK